jgi:hypothetical protein
VTAIKWVKAPADSMWDREAAKLRAQPRVEMVVDAKSSNPSTHAARINTGILAAFKDPDGGRFHARVVDGQILAYYLPPSTATGDDDP